MKKTILITGGAGFIGSHIADAYLNAGHHVVIVDNLTTGFRKNINPRARLYKADVRDRKQVEKILRKEKPDIVNHHAAISEVATSIRDPLLTFETNILGTINLLVSAGKTGVKKFIFASTGGTIYGEPKKNPAQEDAPKKPLSPYALSKLAAEEAILFYSQYYGFNYLIFRYGNVYGLRQNPKGEAGVVAIFSGLMKEKKRPTIFGDGTKLRDYVYIDDIVQANILGLTRGTNEILNLGSGKGISDKNVFDILAQELQFIKKPIYAPFRKGEVYKIVLDSKRARKKMGWRPKITFQEGVRKTLTTL